MEEKSTIQWFIDQKRIRSIIRSNKYREDSVIYMFLDFDGVINIFLLEGTPEYELAVSKDEFDFANRDCVKRLNQLCHDYPQIKVVVSSSWRYAGLAYCQEYLERAGMDPSIRLHDMTDAVTNLPREEHIVDYLFSHEDFRGLIIFDDMKMKNLNEYLVQTDCLIGWNEERDAYARKILDKFI